MNSMNSVVDILILVRSPKSRVLVFRVILLSLRDPTSPSQAVSARRALFYVLRPSDSRSVPLSLSRPFHMPVICHLPSPFSR